MDKLRISLLADEEELVLSDPKGVSQVLISPRILCTRHSHRQESLSHFSLLYFDGQALVSAEPITQYNLAAGQILDVCSRISRVLWRSLSLSDHDKAQNIPVRAENDEQQEI